jgi:hypothetical protein
MPGAGAERILEAAGGLALAVAADGTARVAFGASADWLGPVGAGAWRDGARRALAAADAAPFDGADALGPFAGVALGWEGAPRGVATSVRAYRERPLVVFRSEAREALGGLATGVFAEPALAWPWLRPAQRTVGGVPPGTRSFGWQYTEFAFPVFADADATGAVFAPHRPRVVLPLLFHAPDGRTLLLAPLDAFHEQVIAPPADPARASDGVRAGWHGDLDRVPAGFATELALWAGTSPREALFAWGAWLQERHRAARRGRYADELMARLSYWTDNGGVYYYRTAPGLDYAATLERVVDDLAGRGIPVRAVHLDSWFYPHETLRPVSAEGAPVVPPTGALAWEPRADVFPDGLDGLSRRLGGRPLSLHGRHFSAASPYWEAHPAWVDGGQAHPADPAFFHGLLERAARWGAVTYEQDWMVDSFLGVRGLREEPGRASAWQRGLDAAAAERGLTLLWCMSTPADFLESVRLRQLCAIRTSGDYQYLYDNALNWVWFLHTSLLARALGLWPYKDVFVSHDKTPDGFGEPYAEAESLLAALSGGPVGIGDQIGYARPEVVLRTCREDGVLVKPDRPLAALDRCLAAHPYFAGGPLLAETTSRHPAGVWTYVVAMNALHRTKASGEPLAFRVDLADLGDARPAGAVLAFDWRRGSFERLEPEGGFEESLAYQDFAYRVLCPVLPGELAVFGDVTKYATVGDRRVAGITALDDGVRFDAFGAPGAALEVQGWSAAPLREARAWSPQGGVRAALAHAGGGRFAVRVALDGAGFARVAVRR